MHTRIPLVALFIGLNGCSWLEHSEPGSASLGHYAFTYSIDHRERAQLVQVFDDGKKTYLQFRNLASLDPTLKLNPELPAMTYTRSGPYAVLDGTYDQLYVTANDSTAIVHNARFAPAQPAAGSDDVVLQGQLQASQATIARLQQQLADLTAQLEQRQLANGQRYVLHFANNSAALGVEAPTLADLAAVARAAQQLSVIGYTDAARTSPFAASLAVSRAKNVKAALVRQGIEPTRITIDAYPAGHFAADNSTADGKAQNRRVEIRLTAQVAQL